MHAFLRWLDSNEYQRRIGSNLRFLVEIAQPVRQGPQCSKTAVLVVVRRILGEKNVQGSLSGTFVAGIPGHVNLVVFRIKIFSNCYAPSEYPTMPGINA
jgi:hypothetical protein